MRETVYFIRCAGRIKVGFTTNLDNRLRTFRHTYVDPIELIGAVSGDRGLERALHVRLQKHRVKGEWFDDCADARAVIEDAIERGTDAVAELYVPHVRHKVERPPEPEPPLTSESAWDLFSKTPWIDLSREVEAAVNLCIERMRDCKRALLLNVDPITLGAPSRDACSSALATLKDTNARLSALADDAFMREVEHDEAILTAASEFVRMRVAEVRTALA